MALDIERGDFLVVDSVTYPIRAVEHYEDHGFGVSPAFNLRASVSCKTQRNPAVSDGKRGDPTDNLTGLSCTPLDPVDPEVAHYAGLHAPFTTRQTFISDGTDYARLFVEMRIA